MSAQARLPQRMLFAALPLATGAALLVHILSKVSLLLGICGAVLVGLAAAILAWRQATPSAHKIIKQRAAIGVLAGVGATLAYDFSRYLIVKALHVAFGPFDVFPIFGQLLVGVNAPRAVLVGIGWCYHLVNGFGFAVAFMFLFRRPGAVNGLVWAAFLELCMVSVYPTWLGLKAMTELLSVSILGHAVYGLVLGLLARHGLSRLQKFIR